MNDQGWHAGMFILVTLLLGLHGFVSGIVISLLQDIRKLLEEQK